eukprot:CAMPEP_0202029024 /NCGR_PEP_ID=MMETSP0905-20130828/63757_1 /ASSEMBLY_ACC=CAM_ASM_000554 /TAXON_ID=420261 /ORGANISM="Thalassiosira antarctica, Strain CCMP982" /LENGTH=827 /DNA_ID=CAMNT_0048592761 /DNA_START=118 /DNA_END=2602 /DNA_ORIENTATION=-
MEAVISTGYNDHDDHGSPPASFSSTGTLEAADDEASMIALRRGRGSTFLKMTGALLFIAGSASVILTLHPTQSSSTWLQQRYPALQESLSTTLDPSSSRPRSDVPQDEGALLFIAGSASVILTLHHTHLSSKTWSTFQQEYYPALQESLSTTLQSVPRLSREVLEGTKATAASMKILFTAESAELAWEKSENAFHQLRHHSVTPLDEEPRENMLGRALEGLEGIFHMRRRGANNSSEGRRGNGNKSNNLRKEGRNNKQQQRNMKKEASRDRRNAKADNNQATDPSSILSTKQEGEEQQSNNGWMSLLSNSPLAAPLLAFCGIVFLVASLIMNLDYRRLHRGRNTIILDEKEAEIVEFYERVECGTLQTIPFLQDVKEGAEEHPIKRSSSERWMMNSERNLPETSLTRQHHRSSSDSSLMRHHVIHPGAEMRENQCDLYYSRVLETLNYEDDDDEVDLVEEQEQMDDGGDDQECQQITILENIVPLTNQKGDDLESEKDGEKADCTHLEEAGNGSDTECFESAPSEEVQEKESQLRCPQSPPSSSSSISSLTSEGYDVEAPFGGENCHQDDSLKVHNVTEASSPLHVSTTIVMPGPEEVVSRNLAMSDFSDYVSSTGATPQRSTIVMPGPEEVVSRNLAMSDFSDYVSSTGATPQRSNLYRDPFGGEHDNHQDDSMQVLHGGEAPSPLHVSTTIVMPGPEELVSRNLALSDFSDYVSSTGATPQRSNLYHDRCQSLIENEHKLRRRVSFSPEVEIREIPTREEPLKANHEQHESYLYIMLFTVAIAIIVFSLMPPAHPSLSPVYNTMTRGDIFQRAESILSSQWDVEL